MAIHKIASGKNVLSNGPVVYVNDKGKIHCEDGPAVIFKENDNIKLHDRHTVYDPSISKVWFVLKGRKLNPNTAWKNPKLKRKYPDLIKSMIIYSVSHL